MSALKLMLIVNPENWNLLKGGADKTWPVSDRYAKAFSRLDAGDRLIVYLSKQSCIAGIIEVTGKLESYDKPIVLRGSIYRYLLPINYKYLLPDDKLLPIREILNNLDLSKNKARTWGSALQRSVKTLSDEDYNFLTSKVVEYWG